MAIPFSVYTETNNGSALTDALFAPGAGITVTSVVLKASGPDAVNLYDGTLAALGIGAGLLLTSGTTPGTANTVGWFGADKSGTSGFTNGDADIDAVVNTVFQTQSYDATTLEFDFTVADTSATSVSFDLVFGSDEYPEWVDQFVDSAIVMVNGVNYALFNHDPHYPLSVVSANLAAGYFQDNAGNGLPIEYDGVSHVLKIVAPINAGGAGNHIKIGIADTGDHIYDSGIFIANFEAGTIPGSGVVNTPTAGTSANDELTGTAQAEYFDLKAGDDLCYAGAGDDIVVAGSGNDSVYGGSGADQLMGDAGNDDLDGGADTDTAVFAGASTQYLVAVVGGGFTVTDTTSGAPEGTDSLTNIEMLRFSDGLFAISAGAELTPVTNPATPPANTAGSVLISGVGALGKTLTATVSDPDGVTGPISYQWQVTSGEGWSNVGTDSNTYTVQAADVGKDIQVVASYTDLGAHPEAPISATKAIQQTGNGDLVVTLMQLGAPVGASTINPLTTLVQDAIALGLSPNQAALGIKAVLGLPDGVNLQSYDAYAVLQGDPGDPSALAVEKIAVQVAILASLSDDDMGMKLSLKIIEAGASQQTLSLADATDLAAILGLDTTAFDISDKKTFPEPLKEIFDRNDNIAQAGDVAGIEAQWQDFLSIQDFVASTSIADLNIHVNQVPTGSATASLVNGLEDTAYTLNASDLLAGFSDSDGGTLSVSGLSADHGTVTDNGDGTFTISPTANYSGPLELSYAVLDGQGGNAPASQLFVIAPSPVTPPINTPPTGTATAVLPAGTEDADYTVSAAALLAGFSDVDAADVLGVSSLSASDGAAVQNGDGSWSITPSADFNGPVTLTYAVTDGHGGSVGGTQNYSLAPVNDAPVLAQPLADQSATTGAAFSYAVPANAFGDVDNATLTYSATLSSGQPLPSWLGFNASTRTFSGTPGTIDGGSSYAIRVTASDGNLSASDIFDIAVGTPGQLITGTPGADTLGGGPGNDTIHGGAGTDTAVFSGALSDHLIRYNRGLGQASVTDQRADGDGTDTLSSIERLQFGSQVFDLLNPPRTAPPVFATSRSFLFDAAFYLLDNPELVPTVTLATAFDHYNSTGAAQGKAPTAWFEPDYYANRWPDLTPLNLDAATLFAHYNLYGVWEGRSAGRVFDLYDGNRYLTENPDVAAYVDAYVADFLGSRSNGAIAHYVIYGAAEGRIAYDFNGQPLDMAIVVGGSGV